MAEMTDELEGSWEGAEAIFDELNGGGEGDLFGDGGVGIGGGLIQHVVAQIAAAVDNGEYQAAEV